MIGMMEGEAGAVSWCMGRFGVMGGESSGSL